MIVNMLLLVSLAHCASQALCPSKEEIASAVRSRTDQAASAAPVEDRRRTAGGLTHAERIVGISDIYCGDALPDDPGAINCKFTVRYPSKIEFQVAELARENKGWVIEDALVVTKRRK